MKSNNQNSDKFSKRLLQIMFVIMLLNVPGCFDSSTEDAPPSVGTSTGGSGGKPLPGVVNDTLSVPPDTAGVVSVLDNDTPIGTGTLTIDSFDAASANNGTVSDNGDGTLTYMPAAGYEGDDTFTYTANDSSGVSASGTVLVTVSQSVIPNGQAFYASNCAICHSAGSDDITSAFLASDLALRANPLTRDLSMYGGQYQLMGAYNALAQVNIDELKAYLATLSP
jgi:hypothetical protein